MHYGSVCGFNKRGRTSGPKGSKKVSVKKRKKNRFKNI